MKKCRDLGRCPLHMFCQKGSSDLAPVRPFVSASIPMCAIHGMP
jgi:hypothetical protein